MCKTYVEECLHFNGTNKVSLFSYLITDQSDTIKISNTNSYNAHMNKHNFYCDNIFELKI